MSKAFAEPKDGTDLYNTMLLHSTEVRWYPLASGVWSTRQVEPTREQLIKSEMKIGRQSRSLIDGKYVFDVRYLTRAEAEADVDRWLARTQTKAIA